jgi:hypothetical protein
MLVEPSDATATESRKPSNKNRHAPPSDSVTRADLVIEGLVSQGDAGQAAFQP